MLILTPFQNLAWWNVSTIPSHWKQTITNYHIVSSAWKTRQCCVACWALVTALSAMETRPVGRSTM